ncbi:MAG: hypothetical protein R2712_24900 [Vicinamibacterales bacterium]
MAAGQLLNLGVFARPGVTGVFYGNRLGHEVPGPRLPLHRIPVLQYVGTVLSIWGLFLVLRYPASDWAVLPLLESVYYALGAIVEQTDGGDEHDTVTERLRRGATAAGPFESRRLR